MALRHSVKLASSMVYSFEDCCHVPSQVKSAVASLPIGLEVCNFLLVSFSDLGRHSGPDRGPSNDFQARLVSSMLAWGYERIMAIMVILILSLMSKWLKSVVTFVIFSVLEVSFGHVGLSGQGTCRLLSSVVIRFAQGPQGPFPSLVLLRRATSTSPFGRCSPASSAPFWASCWRPTRIVFPQLRRCVFWISCLFTKQIRRASGSVDDNEFKCCWHGFWHWYTDTVRVKDVTTWIWIPCPQNLSFFRTSTARNLAHARAGVDGTWDLWTGWLLAGLEGTSSVVECTLPIAALVLGQRGQEDDFYK